MPNHVDILFERLKQFDEVTLLELLDITAEDILTRFKDRVISRKSQLYGEVELLTPEDEELEEDWDRDYDDGFQIEGVDDDDLDLEDFEPGELD